MSLIIIDGYNLIGIQHGDLQKERSALIDRLAAYRKAKGHDITLVFDGWKSGGQKDMTEGIAGIRVIYSRLGDRADLVIKRMISGDKKDWIVITSDRDIMAHAWASGSVPVRSEVFERCLHSAEGSGSGDEAEPEEDEGPAQKGSAHTLSRKDKALQRVLRKL
ncbi:MAG: NYN domain-containing protein [Thermodesulfovibrionales bacterium]